MTNAVSVAQYGSTGTTTAFKNRIINGAMVIDQRNAGVAWGTSINGYTVDRWALYQSVTGKLNGGQNYNSASLPAGFTNYAGMQSQSAYSVGASDYYLFQQQIEGFNASDLGWGTANAKTVTLSFVVQSSLTGTFGGAIQNSATNRSYPFSYTISSANTWTTISVTIAGDTSGTWLTTNGIGITVRFGLGVGSTFSGTAGSWSGNNYFSATGATSVVGTNGATFYITGVQLEVGTQATNFDVRSYGTELALCQRYYAQLGSVSGGSGAYAALGAGYCTSGTNFNVYCKHPVSMRSAPTVTFSSIYAVSYPNQPAVTSINATYPGSDSSMISFAASAGGLTAGNGTLVATSGTTAGYIGLSSEL
jgi:hypothetical protein